MSTSTAIIDIQVKGATAIKDVASFLDQAATATTKLGKAQKGGSREADTYAAGLKNTSQALKIIVADAEKAAKALNKVAAAYSTFTRAFTKLPDNGLKDLRRQATLLNKELEKTNTITAKHLGDGAYMSSVREGKAALLVQKQVNAEIEKQAALRVRVASLSGASSGSLGGSIQNLKQAEAQTARLEKSVAKLSRTRRDDVDALIATSRLESGLANQRKAAIAAGNKLRATTAKNTAATTKNTAATKKAQIAVAGLARSVGVVTMSYASLAPLMAGMALGAATKKVYELGAAFEYTTTYIDSLNEAAGGFDASGIQSAIMSLEGLRTGPVDLAAGMKEFAKAGVDAADAIGQIEEVSKFATLAELDLAEAVKLVVGQANAFDTSYADTVNMIGAAALSSATSIEEMANAMSYTTELATVTGTSFDEVATAMAVMANAGIRGSKAGTALRTSILKMATPTDSLKKKLDDLGISWSAFTSDGNIKDLKTMFTELDRVTKNLPDSERVGVLKDIFGLRALKGGANILNSMGDEWDSLNLKIRESTEGITFLAEKYDAVADTTTAKWEKLGVAIEKSLLQAFDSDSTKAVIESLTSVLASDKMVDSLESIVSLLNETGIAITSLLDMATSLPGDIVDAGLVGYILWGSNGLAIAAAAGVLIDKQMAELQLAADSGDAEDKSFFARKLKIVQDFQEEVIASWEGYDLELDKTRSPSTETETQRISNFNTSEISADKSKVKFTPQSGPRDSNWFDAYNNDTVKGVDAVYEAVTRLRDARASEAILDEKRSLDLALQSSTTSGSGKNFGAPLEEIETAYAAYVKGIAEAQNKLARDGAFSSESDSFMGLDDAAKRAADLSKEFEGLSKSVDEIDFETSLIGLSELDSAMLKAQHSAEAKADKLGVPYEDTRIQEYLVSLQDQAKATEAASVAADAQAVSLKKVSDELENTKKAAQELKDAQESTKDQAASMRLDNLAKELKGMDALNLEYDRALEAFRKSDEYGTLVDAGDLATIRDYEGTLADVTYSMDNLMQAGLEGDNFWDGFNAGLYNAQKDMKKLGELGSDVFTILRDGVKDSFVAIFNGEFDKIGEIWDATLNSMLDSVIDWAAEAAANMVIDATVGFVDDITGGFLSDLGIGNGPKGTPNDPMYVSVVGGAAALSELSADTGLSVSELGNILESSGTAVIDAERLNQSIDSALSTSVGTISSWYAGLTAEANGVNDGTVLSLIEGSYGPSATGETSDTQAVPDTSTSDVWQGYLGMAAGAYGMYSGYNQFDSGNYVGGAVSTAGGAANIYQGGTQAGLWGGEYAGSISSVTGLVGGLYGMYGGISDMLDNGVTAQNAIGTGASAYSTYAAGSTMLSEGGLLAGVGESLGVWSSDALGSIVVNELVVEGGAYAGAELGGAYVGAEVGSSAAGGMGTMGTLGAVGAVFMAIENGHLLAGMMSDRNEPTGKATAESGREYYTYGDQNIVEQIATDVSGYLATATMTDSTMSDNFGIEGEGFTLQQQQDAAEEAKNYVGVYASIADEFGVLGGVIEELGVTTADYNAIVGGTSEALTNSTEAMSGYVDLTTDQVNSLLTYTGDDLIGFASSIGVGFEQLTDVLNGVNGATTSASNSINSMNNDLYTTTLRDPFTGFANGGIVGYAAGGVLEGGSGVRDDLYLGTVNGRRQMAMGGEFIMPKSATQKYLPALQAMQTDSYADGGIVGGTSLDTIMEPIVDSWADYVVKMFDVWEQEVRLRDGGPSQYGAAVYNQDPYDRSASSEDLESIMAGFNDTIGEYTLTSYEDDVRKMNISYSDTIELMKEYGATAEELAKAQMTWELDRAELHKRAAETRSDFMTPYIEMANGATDAEKFMTDLADRYTEAGAAAVKLGASEDELAIIRAAAASEIDGQISSIMDSVEDVIDKDSLSDAEYAAKGINERYDDMRDSLITLRASAGELADLEEARRIELENARGSSALDYYDDLRAMGAQISTFGSQSTPQSLATEPAEQSISVNVLIEGNDIINDGELRSRIVDISDETASDKAEREYSDRVSYPTVR